MVGIGQWWMCVFRVKIIIRKRWGGGGARGLDMRFGGRDI